MTDTCSLVKFKRCTLYASSSQLWQLGAFAHAGIAHTNVTRVLVSQRQLFVHVFDVENIRY